MSVSLDVELLHRALGIASLGDEILASLHALYVKDKFFDKAEAQRIFSFTGDNLVYRALTIGFLNQSASTTQPQVWHRNSQQDHEQLQNPFTGACRSNPCLAETCE